MSGLVVAIPSVTPFLAETARASVLAMTPDAYVQIVYGPQPHGDKLDWALTCLSADAEWFFTLDDDAAVLSPTWFDWLRARMGAAPCAGFDATLTGRPGPMGALYHVPWLRALGASFQCQLPNWDVAGGIGIGSPAFIADPMPDPPWWLRGCRAVADEQGRLLWAHLGGGTIGATNWRLPRRLWPRMIRRALAPMTGDSARGFCRFPRSWARGAQRRQRARRVAPCVNVETLAVAGALLVTGLSIVASALWRRSTRWFAGFAWTPRVTPGIRAEVIMVMSADGHVGVSFEKLAPEDDAAQVFALLLQQLFDHGAAMGVSVNWSSKIGAVIDTPDGPEYVVALIRPAPPTIREQTDLESLALRPHGDAAKDVRP